MRIIRKALSSLLSVSLVLTMLAVPTVTAKEPETTYNENQGKTLQSQKQTDVLDSLATQKATDMTVGITDWDDPDSLVYNNDSGIPDKIFYDAAVESGDDNSNGDYDRILSVSEAKNIEILRIFYYTDTNVKDIRGIQHLSLLKQAWINYDQVKDLSPLENHPSLNSFQYTKYKDSIEHSTDYIFDILSTITNLQYLSFDNININSFDKIKNLDLNSLYLNDTGINNVSFKQICSNYENLRSLVLTKEKKLTDINGISQLNNLYDLTIDNNYFENNVGKPYNVDNLKHISQLENLDYLNLTLVKVDDLGSIVSGLQNLSRLRIEYADINDKVILLNLPLLRDLSIIDSNITAIDLKNCGSLESLSVSRNSIKSLNNITTSDTLSLLRYLSIDRNSLHDLNGIEKFNNINSLSAFENKISNLKGIENLVNLKYLCLSANQLTNLNGIENLTNLISLELSDNQLTNLNGIEKLTKLDYLDLQNNKLINVSGIEYLINLNRLNLSYNNLKTLPSLKNMKKLGSGHSVDENEYYLHDIWFNFNKLTKQELTSKMPDHFINHPDWNDWLENNAYKPTSSSSSNYYTGSTTSTYEKYNNSSLSDTTKKITVGDDSLVQFKIDVDLSKLIYTELNGKVLTLNKDYTATQGSTIITLSPDYIKTLSVGIHKLRVEFIGGYAEFTVVVENPSKADVSVKDDIPIKPSVNPQTSTMSRVNYTLIYLISIGSSIIGLLIVRVIERNKKLKQ